MTPIDKLIKIIDRDLCYTVTELWEKCQKCGFDFTRHKIYADILRGRLDSYQAGGKFSDHMVAGAIFLSYIIDNTHNRNNGNNGNNPNK